MSSPVGAALPDVLRKWLGQPARADDDAVLVLTADADGFPRAAQLSRSEVVAHDPQTLSVATWVASTTAHNLRRTGQLTLFVVADRSCFSVTVRVEQVRELELPAGPRLAHFRGEVIQVRSDAVPYAQITSGVGFRLTSAEATLATWDQINTALREEPS